jgi:Domain of unknown function (DUF4388)
MGITGSLATFSLAEVFQILDRGRKTGCLLLKVMVQPSPTQIYQVWVNSGRIIAVTAQSNNQELLSMLVNRKWMSAEVAQQLFQMPNWDRPLGLCLKEKGALEAEQLKLLFHAQVLQRICLLFKAKDGLFKFTEETTLSPLEMTGLSLSIPEAVLLGLRVLRDWSELQHKLPSLQAVLARPSNQRQLMNLDSVERRVWEAIDGRSSLQSVAEKLALPPEQLRQIAFRLMAVAVAEEISRDLVIANQTPTSMALIPVTDPSTAMVPVAAGMPAQPVATTPIGPTRRDDKPGEDKPVSKSLLHNLVSFLRSKK